MTLTMDPDLHFLKTFLRTKNEVSRPKLSKVRARTGQTTHRHTHRCDRAHYYAAFAGGNNRPNTFRWYRRLGTGGAVAGMISGMLARGSAVSFLAPNVRQRHCRQLSTSLNPMPINEIFENSISRPIARSSLRFSTILSLYST